MQRDNDHLIEKLYKPVRAILRRSYPRLRDEGDLTDALHEGLMALRRWDPNGKSTALSWAVNRAVWAVQDIMRDRFGRNAPKPQETPVGEWLPRPSREVIPDERLLDDINSFAQTLPPGYEDILRLRAQGLNMVEVAEALGITGPTVCIKCRHLRRWWSEFDTSYQLRA